MTQEDIIKYKALQKQLGELIKKYYEEYYAYTYKEYEGWCWEKILIKL